MTLAAPGPLPTGATLRAEGFDGNFRLELQRVHRQFEHSHWLAVIREEVGRQDDAPEDLELERATFLVSMPHWVDVEFAGAGEWEGIPFRCNSDRAFAVSAWIWTGAAWVYLASYVHRPAVASRAVHPVIEALRIAASLHWHRDFPEVFWAGE